MDAFTTVIAVDREHLAEIRETWPTWQRFHPEIAANPLLMLTDGTAEFTSGFPDGMREWRLHQITTADSPTQKDRMLSSLLLDAPRLVTTQQWIKIDTDTIAVGPGKPLTKYLGVESLAAPAWPYTIPVDALDQLDAWWKRAGEEAATPPLAEQGRKEPERDRVHLSRVIGWLTIIDTAFSRRVAELVRRCSPPFISHDTILWYAAQRWGIPAKPANFKRDGWDHVLGLRSIKRRVSEVQLGWEMPAFPPPDPFVDEEVSRMMGLAPPHSRVLAGALKNHFGGTGKSLVGVEIGVYRGETASHLLSVFPNLTLFMVDPWREFPASEHETLQYDRISCQTQCQHDECRKLAYRTTQEFRDRRVVLEMTSRAATAVLPDGLDFGFVDGRHDRPSVEEDLRDLWPKIRSGGVCSGHDFNHRRFTGVTEAVNDFVAANRLELKTYRRKIWSVVKP
jgi:hypothetical protein